MDRRICASMETASVSNLGNALNESMVKGRKEPCDYGDEWLGLSDGVSVNLWCGKRGETFLTVSRKCLRLGKRSQRA